MTIRPEAPHRPPRRGWWLLGLALCLAAAAVRYGLAPQLSRLPGSGVVEASHVASIRARATADGDWTDSTLLARRIDTTLVHSDQHVVIQGDVHWIRADGSPAFVSSGIYGVDRDSRVNLRGYGNTDRDGQFLFPPHTERRDYRVWDPQFLGPRTAGFERVDRIDGLEVLVFRFRADGLDQTAGYVHLADVPERYGVQTDGSGRLWVEPASGRVVEYQEEGVSRFVEPDSRAVVADFFRWTAGFDAPTKAAELRHARRAKWRMRFTEVVAPALLLLLGLGCLLTPLLRRHARPSAGGVAAP